MGCKPIDGDIRTFATIGFDCRSVYTPLDVAGNYLLRITFWDTAGQERYKSMSTMYARGSDILCVMWDASHNLDDQHPCHFKENQSLINAASFWMDTAEAVNNPESPKIIFVVATKCEGRRFTDEFQREARNKFREFRAAHLKTLPMADQISLNNLNTLADDSRFYFVSAKLGVGLITLFTDAIARYKELNAGKIRLLLRGELKSGARLKLEPQTSKKSSSSTTTAAASSYCSC